MSNRGVTGAGAMVTASVTMAVSGVPPPLPVLPWSSTAMVTESAPSVCSGGVYNIMASASLTAAALPRTVKGAPSTASGSRASGEPATTLNPAGRANVTAPTPGVTVNTITLAASGPGGTSSTPSTSTSVTRTPRI